MDLIESVISNLAKEEIRAYKLLATRTGKATNRKDTGLFDLLRKKGSVDFEKIATSFPGLNENAYYRLRNRLLADLSKTLVWLHADKNSSIRSLHYLLLSRIYNFRQLPSASVQFLKKAEKEAVLSYQYELLDLIYSDLIKTCVELTGTDPSPYIKKRRKNRKDVDLLRQTDEILAVITHRLRVTQNFSDADNSIHKLLEKATAEFTSDKSILKNPKLRIGMYKAVSQSLLGKRDYPNLEKYLTETYDKFCRSSLFTRETHDLKLQMLTYLANACFKNERHQKSLKYAALLEKSMKEFNGFLQPKYQFFHLSALVINYSVTDKDKAINLLESLSARKFPAGQEYYRIFIPLNLAVLWFDKQEPRKSIRYLSRLYLEPHFQESAPSLRLKIAVAEMIIRYQLQDEETFAYRLNQVRLEFKKLLTTKQFKKETDFLNILENLFNGTDQRNSFIHQWKKQKEDDSEVIRYIPFLQSLNT